MTSKPLQPEQPTHESVSETVDFDWASAAAEEGKKPDETDELARVFWQNPIEKADDKGPELMKPPVIEDLDLPAISNKAEAENSGSVLHSKKLHTKAINPIGSKTIRRPSVPRAKLDFSTVSASNSQSSAYTEDFTNKKAKRNHRGCRRKKSLEERMLASGQQRVTCVIPWHKVAVLLVILFAAAGAWLATEGQDIAANIMHRLGLQMEADHQPYLNRFATTDPVLLLTMDADAWLGFYRECAATFGTVTITGMNSFLASSTTVLNVDEIDRLTLAVDRQGQILVLISVKNTLNRRRLIYDFGRGMSSSEKLDNNITLHSGFVGRDTPIQYALINENTLAIGEASALKEFLAVSDDTPVPMIV